ncbi:ABC transporter permease [Maricaulis sp.]|uniref:ABC transporter permease n=1 Tax=Maricaulis sp. TaxID=1486257 RepID=UPI001B1547B6|nr:ABC transporter permease [Maricaulis sp.]MBO6796525.1 ABC transporter permease [Maricaulis sp.]
MSGTSTFWLAMRDIQQSLSRPAIWLRLGVRDVVLQYSRAGIGVAWSLINALVWIGVVYVFLGPALSEGRSDYLTYVAAGVVTFNFMSGIIAGGTGAMTRLKGPLLNLPLPIFACALRHVTATFTHLLIQSMAVVGAMLIDGITVTTSLIWILPALAVLLIAAVFVTAGLMVVGVLVGDLSFMIQSLMRLLLFATPVFWFAGDVTGSLRYQITLFNPFAHLLDLIRAPILGEMPSILNVNVAFGTVAAAMLIGFALFAGNCRNVRRWL